MIDSGSRWYLSVMVLVHNAMNLLELPTFPWNRDTYLSVTTVRSSVPHQTATVADALRYNSLVGRHNFFSENLPPFLSIRPALLNL